MKNFNVNYFGKDYIYSLPTDKKEVTIDYLKSVTEDVHVAPNYSLVALLNHVHPATVINNRKSNKEQYVGVIPVLVNKGDTDSDFIKSIPYGSTIVVSGSDLAMAQHIVAKYNELDMNKFINVATSDENKELYKELITSKEYVYFVSFKLVPNTFITAYRSNPTPNVNYFKPTNK